MTQLLTINDVAGILKLKPMTVRLRQWRGEIPFVKIGTSIRFRPEDIEYIVKNGYHPIAQA